MTPKQAIRELKELQLLQDPEAAHIRADEILCLLLIELGHSKIIKEWAAIAKWYA